MTWTNETEQRLTELRARNLAPVATVRRGLHLTNVAESTTDIYLYDAIGGWDGVTAKDMVGALNATGGRRVNLYINSPGGDIFEGHAIHNAIKRYNGVVTGYIDGIAASAASYIAMACDDLWAAPNAQIMIHDGQGLCMGPAADMRECADLLDLLSDSIAEMYAERAGGEAGEWRAKMRNTTWFNASQALDAKLISGVHRPGDMNANTNQRVVGEHGPELVTQADRDKWGLGNEVHPVPTTAQVDAMVDAVTERGEVAQVLPPEWFGGLSSGLKGLFA